MLIKDMTETIKKEIHPISKTSISFKSILLSFINSIFLKDKKNEINPIKIAVIILEKLKLADITFSSFSPNLGIPMKKYKTITIIPGDIKFN